MFHIDPKQLLGSWHVLLNQAHQAHTTQQAMLTMSPLAWMTPLQRGCAPRAHDPSVVSNFAASAHQFIDELATAWGQAPVDNSAAPQAVWEQFLDLASSRHQEMIVGQQFIDRLSALVNTAAGTAPASTSRSAPSTLDVEAIASGDQYFRRALDHFTAVADVQPLPSERTCILSRGTMRLFRYEPLGEPRVMPPLLIVYSLVNTPDILDLDPERSLVRRLLDQGIPVYLIDWGFPEHQHQRLGLEDYVEDLLQKAVAAVREDAAAESIDLLGVCQGGVFTLAFAAIHANWVRRLALLVTPVDYHTPDNTLSLWSRNIDFAALTERCGNIPGPSLYWLFASLRPYDLIFRKYLHALTAFQNEGDARRFMRMEQWVHNVPDHSGRAFREFSIALYQKNALIKDAFRIGERRVRLAEITAPVLNVFAQRDHIVPPASSQALGQHLRTHYTPYPRAAGHIGIMVSRRHCQPVAEKIGDWLCSSDTTH